MNYDARGSEAAFRFARINYDADGQRIKITEYEELESGREEVVYELFLFQEVIFHIYLESVFLSYCFNRVSTIVLKEEDNALSMSSLYRFVHLGLHLRQGLWVQSILVLFLVLMDY